ncbi:TDT family transporter [Paraclostridium ghonii]|uniref:Tellurite resistance protein TehA-like permease n=1 Tax=Paraclostridium ghonii TaxID=29358 RepID=A0ABU0MXZ9_9FIRM|nr:TDT family transporter [Paeniclostridium ghonii]MDQ0555772.1 tellurite resistance protein TehA-like permease [Paeniclostridium ghonii]
MEATNKGVKSKFEDIPVAIAGIALGFMSISTALLEFNITWVRHLAVVFSVLCIGFLLTKLILYPNKVINEIKHPMVGSIYPTIFMTLMLIAVYLVEINPSIASGLWLGATVLHFTTFVMFAICMVKDFKMENMIPSWFIPTVGIGLAAVTSKPMNMPGISRVLFYYSLVAFILMFPIMIYRLVSMEKLTGPKLPTLMIMVAPANICLAAYFAIADKPNSIFVSVLAAISYMSLFYGYTILPKLIKLPFSPGLAPLTFPLGISVVASQRYAKYLGKIGSPLEGVVRLFLYVQVIIAILVIGYIVVKTIGFLFKKLNPNKSQNANMI